MNTCMWCEIFNCAAWLKPMSLFSGRIIVLLPVCWSKPFMNIKDCWQSWNQDQKNSIQKDGLTTRLRRLSSRQGNVTDDYYPDAGPGLIRLAEVALGIDGGVKIATPVWTGRLSLSKPASVSTLMRFLACNHYPAAAFMLGAIKRRIHSSQDSRTRRSMLRKDGNTEGESNCFKRTPFGLRMDHSG